MQLRIDHRFRIQAPSAVLYSLEGQVQILSIVFEEDLHFPGWLYEDANLRSVGPFAQTQHAIDAWRRALRDLSDAPILNLKAPTVGRLAPCIGSRRARVPPITQSPPGLPMDPSRKQS